jgi:HEAT repeat protein
MKLFLGLIIGLAAGGGVVYWLMKQQLDRQQKELQQSQQILLEVQQAQVDRRKELENTLEADYRKRFENETMALSSQYNGKIKALEAEVAALKKQAVSEAPPVVVPTTLTLAPEATSAPPSVSTTNGTSDVVEPLPVPSPVARSLQEKLASIGTMGRLSGIAQLVRHADSPDTGIREQVAISLGQLTASRMIGADVQRAIPVLGRLSRDRSSAVRRAAIEALGQIRSEQVIPFLERSLRDTDRQVVKAASWAIAKFKFFRTNQPAPPPPQKPDNDA